MRFVVEHKTSGESITPGSVYWRRLLIDVQVDYYYDGAEALAKRCDGILFDVLGKPTLRPKLSTPVENRKYVKKTGLLYANQRDTDESPDEFEKRCLDKIIADPDRYYQRQTIVRLEAERYEANMDVWQTATAIREAKRLNVYPRNPDSCIQWNRACDYFEVCTGTQSIEDPVLFKIHELEHEELGPQGQGLLTQSSLRCFRSCQRRYYYRYVLKARPLVEKAETLLFGTSIHRALEAWWKTGGDLAAALTMLDQKDLYRRAKERAMIIGYHARWDKPPPTEFVEAFFDIPLVNPETGVASRTFRRGGKIDAIADLDEPIKRPNVPLQTLEASLSGELFDTETGEVVEA